MYGFPRTVGFGSGSVNYGVIGLLLPLNLWLWINSPGHRKLWGFCAISLFVGMILSLQRSAMILPFVGIAFYFFTKSWKRLTIAYVGVAALLVTAIFYSDFLADRLMDINDAIASDGKWAGSVLRVATFGDRLNGWERLKDPSRIIHYSAGLGQGTLGDYRGGGKGEYHDVINVILESYGLVGVILTLAQVFVGFR